MEAIASRVEAIASRVEAIAGRLVAIAGRLEAVAGRLECLLPFLFAITIYVAWQSQRILQLFALARFTCPRWLLAIAGAFSSNPYQTPETLVLSHLTPKAKRRDAARNPCACDQPWSSKPGERGKCSDPNLMAPGRAEVRRHLAAQRTKRFSRQNEAGKNAQRFFFSWTVSPTSLLSSYHYIIDLGHLGTFQELNATILSHFVCCFPHTRTVYI